MPATINGSQQQIGSTSSNDFLISYAIRRIKALYGDVVSVDVKNKELFKFGWNQAVGSSVQCTLMEFAGSETSETLPTDNVIDSFVTDDGDFVGNVTVEGHTISGTDLTFSTQTFAATGQTRKALSTSLARANRVYNTSGSPLAAGKKGYVYNSSGVTLTDGVPDLTAQVHVIMTADDNQSQKAATALSSTDYWIITEWGASINKKTTASADVRLQIREPGGVFRSKFAPMSLSTAGQSNIEINVRPYLIVPKNSDIRATAIASTTAVSVSAWFSGYLAKVVV